VTATRTELALSARSLLEPSQLVIKGQRHAAKDKTADGNLAAALSLLALKLQRGTWATPTTQERVTATRSEMAFTMGCLPEPTWLVTNQGQLFMLRRTPFRPRSYSHAAVALRCSLQCSCTVACGSTDKITGVSLPQAALPWEQLVHLYFHLRRMNHSLRQGLVRDVQPRAVIVRAISCSGW